MTPTTSDLYITIHLYQTIITITLVAWFIFYTFPFFMLVYLALLWDFLFLCWCIFLCFLFNFIRSLNWSYFGFFPLMWLLSSLWYKGRIYEGILWCFRVLGVVVCSFWILIFVIIVIIYLDRHWTMFFFPPSF